MGFQLLNLNWFWKRRISNEPSMLYRTEAPGGPGKDWNFGSSEPPSFLAMKNLMVKFGDTWRPGSYILVKLIIATSHEPTWASKKVAFGFREIRGYFRKILAWWMIIIWPDIRFRAMSITHFVGEYG